MAKTALHSINVRVPKSDYRQLEKLAKPENVSVLMRKIIREYLCKISVDSVNKA